MYKKINKFANDSFHIKDAKVNLYPYNVPLIDIVKDVAKRHKGPLLLNFPHLVKKQINILFQSFENAKKEFDYKGSFNALFPLKTNQFHTFLDSFKSISKDYPYGMEAGSKAEIILALAYNNKNQPIMINGFKDEEIIKLAFSAKALNYNITIVIEGLDELDYIIKYSKIYPENIPNIGIRAKLHNLGRGLWENSSGTNSKFGLSANELVKAIKYLKQNNLIKYFVILHFHIGSQMSDIRAFKKALIEAGHIYIHLKSMGANALENINIGGGLGVEYSLDSKNKDINYTIVEFANDVIFLLKNVINKKEIKEPNIYIESGRFIASSHTVLVAPVLELYSTEYQEKDLNLKYKNPSLIKELKYMYENIQKDNALEYLHDAFLHMQTLLNLFDLGYIDLIDRSNMDILVNLLIKKSLLFVEDFSKNELKDIQDMLQEKYLVNFSIFQSLPDFWGLNQKFPIMPLDRLDTNASRSARLWDITCDSDGEMVFDKKSPLYLHDVDLSKEDYYLGFFLVGAYQEILAMKHNLFVKPTQVIVDVSQNKYIINKIITSDNILDILKSIGYQEDIIKENIFNNNQENKKEIDYIQEILQNSNYLQSYNK